jgi:D-aspartate ligase
MKKALVVGCHVMGLGVVRALHLKGIPTVALHYERTDLAHWSRYPSERVRVPNPDTQAEAFIEFLIDHADRWGGSLVVPTNDASAATVSRHKAALSEHYVVAVADWPVLQRFVEKGKQYELAEEAGVPYPLTFTPESADHLEARGREIQYPCILKPTRSHEFKAIFHTKNFEVHDLSDLKARYRLCMDHSQPVVVQEIVPGPDTNIRKMQGYVNSEGRMVGRFFLRKLRSNPPPFGVGRVDISTGRDSETEVLSEKLLSTAGYRGFFSIEFKKDPRDGKLKLMENNIRLVRINWLATSCGINFPWLIYTDLMEGNWVDIETYTEGLYWIEFYSDVLNSLFKHRREDVSLRDYFRPYLSHKKCFAILSLRDPMPFVRETLLLWRVLLRLPVTVQTPPSPARRWVSLRSTHPTQKQRVVGLIEERNPSIRGGSDGGV